MKKILKTYIFLWSLCVATLLAVLGLRMICDATKDAISDITRLKSKSFAYNSDKINLAHHDADKVQVTELLVESIVQIESGGNPKLVGSHGERGLMQLKKGTWSDVTTALYGHTVSFNKAFNPDLNRKVGSSYLAYLYGFIHTYKRHWQGDERSLLLACYNAGPNCVKAAGFSLEKLPPQTQDYVKRASALHDWLLSKHQLEVKQQLVAQISLKPANS